MNTKSDAVYQKKLLLILSKRYRLRMRQIRNRRKIVHQRLIQKYFQYMQASQKLFQSYALKIIELFELSSPARMKKDKMSEDWWLKTFPNLSQADFLQTFHVSRNFYEYLCTELRPNLEPLPNKVGSGNIPTTVEKQVALSLYKLATGETYKKTSHFFGVHHTTVHKLFIKFLKAVLNKFEENLNHPSLNEREELALKMSKNYNNITDVIGIIVEERFRSKPSCDIEEYFALLGIVDIYGKIRCSRDLEEFGNEEIFYNNVKKLCSEPPQNSTDEKSNYYFVISDRDAPKYDCIINQKDSDNSDQNLSENIVKILEIKEETVKLLKNRWKTLRSKLDYLPPMITLVITAAVCLHNLCIDKGEVDFINNEQSDCKNDNEETNQLQGDIKI